MSQTGLVNFESHSTPVIEWFILNAICTHTSALIISFNRAVCPSTSNNTATEERILIKYNIYKPHYFGPTIYISSLHEGPNIRVVQKKKLATKMHIKFWFNYRNCAMLLGSHASWYKSHRKMVVTAERKTWDIFRNTQIDHLFSE
jgi:hypothetical protein